MEEHLPPGFRFHPTDEELITCYLNCKVSDTAFTSKAIVDVDLNKCEPWDLPAKASMGEKEWYFFSLRDRKYPTGLRTNRATEAGYWKTTGKDKEIYRGGVLVGMKKTLVFYKGRAPRGEKSNWVMHEYRIESKHPFKPAKDEWVVCRVFQKSEVVKKSHEPQASHQSLGSPCETTSMVNEFEDIKLPNLNAMSNSSSNIRFNTIPPQGFNPSNLPSLSWSSSLLGSNLAMDSLLLKALQLRNYQQTEATSTNYNSFLAQDIASTHQFGGEFGTNFHGDASSSKDLDSVPQSQQGQPFNSDSLW